MIKRFIPCVLLVICFLGCKKVSVNANAIIDKSIEISGGELIEKASINFDFRDKHYSADRNNGIFELKRTFNRESYKFTDKLTNSGFTRSIGDSIVKVVDSMIPRYSASVNSVHYFSVLPYGLNDTAVNKSYLNDVEIKGKRYHKIKVTFSEEGGGEDFEDVFIYYVASENFKVDYFSYSYDEGYGIGLRFREAYNERYINGIRFVDYNNYKPKNEKESLDNLEVLLENDGLELLSKIELKNIKVEI